MKTFACLTLLVLLSVIAGNMAISASPTPTMITTTFPTTTTTPSPTPTITTTTSLTTVITPTSPTTTTVTTTSLTITATPATSTTTMSITTSPTTTATSTSLTNTATPTNTAVSSATLSDVTSLKTSSPPFDIKDPCQKDSCSGGSSCVNLNKEHFCLCIDGYYYKSSKCNKGKTFPGTITVRVPDTSELENEKSEAYEKLHTNVITFFEGAFAGFDYGQTVIHNVRILPSARSELRADDKSVNVTVVNLFPENTAQSETTVSKAITSAITNNSAGITGYTEQDRCDFYGCVKNGQDDCSSGFLCDCKEGLERPNPQTPVCLAVSPKCPDTCSEQNNMQCLVKKGGNPYCVCLPGYQEDAHGTCQECAFGYSGVDCKDQFQLILVIVGCIAGILILGMVIALILVRTKKHKDDEEQNLIENDFQNLRLQPQTTGFSNPGAEGSIFPKVRANFSRDNQLQNPYVSQRSMPRPDY